MPGPFQSIQRAADDNGVTYQTVANKIKRNELRVFRLPDKRGHYVDLNEARRVLGKRQKYGSFGPDVKVIDLSAVAGEDFEVVE